MTDRQIEESLRRAVNETAPDMLGDLMSELGLERTQPEMPAPLEMAAPVEEAAQTAEAAGPERRPVVTAKKGAGRRWSRALAGCAAVFLVFLGGFAMFGQGDKVNAVVGLDVNPSIEISVDSKGRVVSVDAVNEEGQKILEDMDLKKDDVSDACNVVVDKLRQDGYLTPKSNSVLVSVRSQDPEAGRTLEEKLSGSINEYLGSGEIKPAIVGQYVEETEDLDAFASDNNISLGKASLIKNIVAAGKAKATEESLLKLSTQELVLLSQTRGGAGDVTYGQADTSEYISREQARDSAFAAAGISGADATGVEVEFDCDDGVIVYEVEFTAGGREYDYDIDATTGKVVTYESERDDGDVDDDRDDRDDRDDDEDIESDDDRDDDDADDDRNDRDDDDDDDRDGDDDDDDDRDDDDD